MTRAPQHYFVDEVVDRDVARALDRLAGTEDVVHVAAMPDVHLADQVCVGCVAATTHTLYPGAVGGDLGCGMAAVRLGAVPLDRATAAALLVRLADIVPAHRHPTAGARLPDELDVALSAPALDKLRRGVGRVQFATLGRGNHFVELQRAEDDGALWLMLHSGSRGIGQAIHDHHVAKATATRSGLHALDADAPAGRAYLDDLGWALAYARASRRAMAARVVAAIAELAGADADWATYRDVHHNHVRREDHGGRALWVHRKGAIAAALDEPGVIPGSMGSPSYHVRGRGEPTSLASSSHGAGRAMSRGEARRAITASALVAQLDGVWFDHRRAHDLRDEAPAAYKDIGRVMRAQKALTRIERTLHPVLCFKAS